MKNIILILVFVVIIIAVFFFYPPKTDNNLADNPKNDSIIISSPLAGATISSPLTVEGFARGSWYFEASFPLILTDWDGRIIAEHYATAQSDWMTTEFVPFKGVLEFEKPQSINGFSKRGTLIFKKDNPSGLPEHDDALEITVYFE